MKIQEVELYRYDLPLTAELTLAGEAIKVRSGLVVELVTDCNSVSYGDIAPLPGFSAESVADAEKQVNELRKTLLLNNLQINPSSGITANWFAPQTFYPSVRFGLESALQTLVSQTAAPPSFRPFVPVCGLIAGDRSCAVDQAHQFRTQGYRAVKLKIGRRSVADEVALVRDIRQALGDEIALRLDANRAWTDCDANSFARGISECHIEYIEEPLADPAGLNALYEATGIPIALDESIVNVDSKAFTPQPGTVALVLKPTFLGGIRITLDWANRARDLGLTPVLSAAFESGLGINALVQLAARAEAADIPAGLDTYGWLAEDNLKERLEIQSGRLDTRASARRAAHLDFSRLRKVDLG